MSLFAGHGSLYSYLTAMPILVKQFSGSHEGKVISLLEAFYAGSPLLIQAIYSQTFASDDPSAGDDNVAGFFLFKALSLTACSILCLTFVRDVPESAPKQWEYQELTVTKPSSSDASQMDESTSLLKPSSPNTLQYAQSGELVCFERMNSLNTSYNGKAEELTPLVSPDSKSLAESCRNVLQGWFYNVKQALSSVMRWPILLVMASYCMAYPVCFGLEINLASMTKSSGYDSYFNMLYLTYNLSVIGSRLLIGALSDKLSGSVPRTLYIAFVSFIMTAALIAGCLQPASIVTLYVLVLAVGLYAGVVKCMTLAVLSREMGVEDLARNFAVCLFISPIFLALWQWFMTYFYEASIVIADTDDCYGDDCFRWSYLMSACLTAFSTICSVLVAVLKRY